jgi:hypothetical protein
MTTGWTNLPADEDTDWTSWPFRAQFWDALVERMKAVGAGVIPEAAAYTADIDAHQANGGDLYSVGGAQTMVETLLFSYLRPANMAGITYVPSGYPRWQFWSDFGAPAEARPAEDVNTTSFPWPYNRVAITAADALADPALSGHGGDIGTWTVTGGVGTWSFETPPDKTIVFVGEYWIRRAEAPADWIATTRVGWTRKHPRQIARTSDDGEPGERARLIGTPTSENDWIADRMFDVRATPPASPVLEATYGVQAGATDAWEEHGGDLATWTGEPTAWSFRTPTDGTQWLFNFGTIYLVKMRNCRAWIRQGPAWQPAGELYEYGEDGWERSADQATPPDTVTTYGIAQPGDFVGPWLWNELQTAINLLHLTKASGASFGHGNGQTHDGGSGLYEPDLATAQAAAQANWAATPPRMSGASGPRAYNGASTRGGSYYSAGATKDTSQQALTFPNTSDPALTVDVTFYVIGTQPSWGYALLGFADFGDPIANGVATAWHTITGASNAGPFVSPHWPGADTFPGPPWADPDAAPVDPYGNQGAVTGYDLFAEFGTKEHARTGGFTYQ